MRHMGDDSSDAFSRESLLLRGTLDMCVLALLRTPNHAYGVVQALQDAGFSQVSYGTVYPLVSRVRRLGLVSQETRPGEGGPARNVLTLTERGEAALAQWGSSWRDHHQRVVSLLHASDPLVVADGTKHV